MEALKFSGSALRYASEEIKYDKKFLIDAIKLNYEIYKYTSFMMDHEFILNIMKSNINVFSCFDYDL